MTFEGAVIREQGVTFAIVVVKPHVVQNQHAAIKAINAFSPHFPGMPVVVMGQDSRGTPIYVGRKDISSFLANVPLSAIPWKQYTF